MTSSNCAVNYLASVGVILFVVCFSRSDHVSAQVFLARFTVK
jgi:hypothetical protein